MSNYDLENNFTQHACDSGKQLYMATLRHTAKCLAKDVLELCPDSRERSLALTKVEEALFWANAAISRSKE